MDYILLTISIACSVVFAVCAGIAGKSLIKEKEDTHSYNTIQYLISFIIFLTISLTQKVSLISILFGAGFGFVTVFGSITKIRTLTMGPMYITNLVVAASMIIPTVFGTVYGDELGGLKILFIILLVLFLFITTFKKTEGEKANVTWVIMLVLTFVLIGSIGVLQRFFREQTFGNQTAPFLASAFLVAFIYSTVMSREKCIKNASNKKFLTVAALSGICVYVTNHVNLYLSGVLPSPLFIPLVNGVPLVLTSIVAITFFKEKITWLQAIGLIGSTASLVCICLF